MQRGAFVTPTITWEAHVPTCRFDLEVFQPQLIFRINFGTVFRTVFGINFGNIFGCSLGVFFHVVFFRVYTVQRAITMSICLETKNGYGRYIYIYVMNATYITYDARCPDISVP